MAKLQINEDLIKTITNQNKDKFLKNRNKTVNTLVALSVDALSKKVSYINTKNVILQPVNELINDSYVDNSNCVYFLGIENAQLELNSTKKLNIWKNFKYRLVYAWKNRKVFKRKRRFWRKRKINKDEGNLEKIKFDPAKYSMFNLAEDLQTSMVNFLTETSIIELKDTMLKIIGKDDFGSTASIIIYLVSYSNGKFKYFLPNKRGFVELDINSRVNKINEKITAVGPNFVDVLKVFNTLYYNINSHMPNQIFMESLLCSVPNELFEGNDIYKVFKKIINYVSIRSLSSIQSINDSSKNICNDNVCGNCAIYFNKMVNLVI